MEYKVTCVSMGNPHAVVVVDSLDEIDLPKIGPKFETHLAFPARVNTEFVEVSRVPTKSAYVVFELLRSARVHRTACLEC